MLLVQWITLLSPLIQEPWGHQFIECIWRDRLQLIDLRVFRNTSNLTHDVANLRAGESCYNLIAGTAAPKYNDDNLTGTVCDMFGALELSRSFRAGASFVGLLSSSSSCALTNLSTWSS